MLTAGIDTELAVLLIGESRPLQHCALTLGLHLLRYVGVSSSTPVVHGQGNPGPLACGEAMPEHM